MASASSDQKLRDFLLAQSPVWLTERLLSAAAGDPVLLAGLQVAASGSDGAQIVRRELDRANLGRRVRRVGRGADLLTEVRGCYEGAGASAEFADYVRRLRAAHRRKDGESDIDTELACACCPVAK